MDSSESELGILDLIQVFVETLDKCFENVCELDLIFHADAVHHILSELVMGGMVLQTNMADIMARIEEQNKLVKQEAGISAAPARAVSAVKSMNIPQQIKDIKLPDLPQAIKDLKFWPGQSHSSNFVDNLVLQRSTPTSATFNPSTTFTSVAAYALNNSNANSNYISFQNTNLYTTPVSQFLNQSIYEPIEDGDTSALVPSAEAIASTFNYDYYQSETSMNDSKTHSFKFNLKQDYQKKLSNNLAEVAEAHEQNMRLFRESFDLEQAASTKGTNSHQKKKHKKSKKSAD